jgi:cysteine desulfurase
MIATKTNLPLYFDYNSTTPMDPLVLEAMLPFMTTHFGNPANQLHAYGWAAQNAIDLATRQTAHLIGSQANEIIWNSGATEGNNSVFWGLVKKIKQDQPGEKIHFITSQIEHASVIQTFEHLKKHENIEFTVLPVDQNGFITLEQIEKNIQPHTKLISIMWVNNEIGTIQPIEQIANFCQTKKIYLHTDATQAIGKIQIDLKKYPIHFLTASAHKMYGPKGIGFLYTRSLNPHIQIENFLSGGGHQNNRRSGTLNVPAIVGAGMACEILNKNFEKDSAQNKQMQKLLYTELKKEFADLILNGPSLESGLRSSINLSLTFPTKPIDLYITKLLGLAFSQGSACHTGETTSSPVLKAIGLTELAASCTLRLSVGRLTTVEHIYDAVRIFKTAFAS